MSKSPPSATCETRDMTTGEAAAYRMGQATVTHAVRSPPEISQDIAYSMWGLLERAVLTVPGMYTVWHDDAHKVLSKCKRETGTP